MKIAISGGSRGIGYATAQVFAEQGWTIFTASRKKEYLDQMHGYWKATYPQSQLFTSVADLSTIEGCQLFASEIKEQTSDLQIVVNNVGQFAQGTLLGGEEGQLLHFFQTNILSAHYLTRNLYPLLENKPTSHLFTIGSIAADNWPPQMGTYALSKESLHAWHRGVTKELSEKNIPTTLIIPGATYTSSWDGIDINPADLLSANEVAQLIWNCWDSKNKEKEITIVK